MASNKATAKKSRLVVQPQRRHGKERVAALLEAAAAVIAEKGYDSATMAEIAARAASPIGSLYRFFPNKELIADALVKRYAKKLVEAFDAIDKRAKPAHLNETADALLHLLVTLKPEMKPIRALLEARSELSAKRLEFRDAALKRIAHTLRLLAPALPKKEARDMAVIVLHAMKTMAALTFQEDVPNSPGATKELRLMNRLYLAHKLAANKN